jgi:hypothetical protein
MMIEKETKMTKQTTRRTDAQRLVNELRTLLDERMETQYGIAADDYSGRMAFLTGYLTSLLGQVAGSSPAALESLKGSVAWVEEQNALALE